MRLFQKLLPALSLGCAALAAFTISCSKKSSDTGPAPTASFNYTLFNSSLRAPATLRFTNSSQNATDYSWNFGDGGTSSSREPDHRFTTGGTYTVTLKASSSGGTNSTTRTVTIAPAATKVKVATMAIYSLSGQTSAFSGYFRIVDISNNVLYTSGTFNINPAAFPVNYQLGTPPLLTNINQSYYFEVWKVGLINTRLGSVPFLPSLYNRGTEAADSYPTRLTNIQATGITMGTDLEWQ